MNFFFAHTHFLPDINIIFYDKNPKMFFYLILRWKYFLLWIVEIIFLFHILLEKYGPLLKFKTFT